MNITAIMPVFNGEYYLPRSKQMISECMRQNDEIIVINDASTDNSLKNLIVWAKEDQRVRIIDNKKPGLTNALNLGVKESQNNWIARFDVDDIYAINRIKFQSQAIGDNIGAIFSDYELVKNNEESLGVLPSAINSHATSVSLINGARTPHPSVLFSKEVYRSVGGYRQEDYLIEDLSLWLRITREAQIISVPELLLKYRIHKDSTSLKKQQLMRINRSRIIQNIGIYKPDIEYCKNNMHLILKSYAGTQYEQMRQILFLADYLKLYRIGSTIPKIGNGSILKTVEIFINSKSIKSAITLLKEKHDRTTYKKNKIFNTD